MYGSTENTSLRDFYIMTLYRTYGHVSAKHKTYAKVLPCGQRTMLQELQIVNPVWQGTGHFYPFVYVTTDFVSWFFSSFGGKNWDKSDYFDTLSSSLSLFVALKMSIFLTFQFQAREVKEEPTLILVYHVMSTVHQILKLVLNMFVMIILIFSFNC